MKKRVYGRKLSRSLTSRKALFRSLIRALVSHGSITTTLAKAKAVQSDVEKLVKKARKGGIAKRREVYAYLANDKTTTDKLFKEVAQAFSSLESGFTRIVKLAQRRGDGAQMARLEWSREVQGRIEKNKGKGKVPTRDKKQDKKIVKLLRKSKLSSGSKDSGKKTKT